MLIDSSYHHHQPAYSQCYNIRIIKFPDAEADEWIDYIYKQTARIQIKTRTTFETAPAYAWIEIYESEDEQPSYNHAPEALKEANQHLDLFGAMAFSKIKIKNLARQGHIK
ncbi:hypothetical protein BDF22DRAFT_653750 [Syncephalis plumigaleata]|nr:hypothetical protein BDF22DRAFT_653750 [Syncephalis plumigaleata]